jgi:hypothetical protein
VLAVPDDAGEAMAVAAVRACARELAGRPVQVLSGDGTMEPRFVALPVSPLLALVGWPGAVFRIVEQSAESYAVGYARRPAVADRLEHAGVAPAADLLSYVDQLRRAPARHGDGRSRADQAEVVRPAFGIRSEADRLSPGHQDHPAERVPAAWAPERVPAAWAPERDGGGDGPERGARPRGGPAREQIQPGVVPEWDEVLRRQSRSDLRRPPSFDEVRHSPSWYERYGRTAPEVPEAPEAAGPAARNGVSGRHHAEATDDDAGWADDEEPDVTWAAAPRWESPDRR